MEISDRKFVCKELRGLCGLACFLFSLLPFPLVYFLSDILFYPLYYGIRYRRKVTRKNLTESFPEKSLVEIMMIEKHFYHFFLDCFFETCKMATLSEKEIKKRMKFINLDLLNETFHQGRSVSLYLGHYCNWEWTSAIAMHLDPSIFIGQTYRKINHSKFNQLMLTIRSRFGASNLEMGQVVRWLAAMKNKKTIVSYVADQAPTWNNIHHWVQFLHHDAPVFTGAEKIARKNHHEAYFLDIRRKQRGYYEATFIRLYEATPPIKPYSLTTLYFKQLEKTIRRYPEYYLWTHNRFKRTRQEYNEKRNKITTNRERGGG